MKSPTIIADETRRELTRLKKCIIHARLHGDEVTETACILRWADLYRAAGGAGSPLPAVVLTERQRAHHRLDKHVPLWRIRQKLSPVVAIVKVEEVRFKRENGCEDWYFVEHLACGHTHSVFEGHDYSARSKRRRCKECGDHAMIAAGYAGDLTPAHSAAHRNSTASLLGPLPGAVDSTFALILQPKRDETPTPRVFTVPKSSPPRLRREPGTAVSVSTIRESSTRD